MRNVKLLPIYIECIHRFEKALGSIKTPRFSQQHAPLLAGYWLLFNDKTVSEEDAINLVRDLDYVEKRHNKTLDIMEKEEDQDQATDSVMCLQHLFHSKVRVSNESGESYEHTISDLLYSDVPPATLGAREKVEKWKTHSKEYMLRQCGILLAATDAGVLGIRILHKHPILYKIYTDTAFQGQWHSYLKRIPGAYKTSIRGIEGFLYATFIPLNFEGLPEKKQEEIPF